MDNQDQPKKNKKKKKKVSEMPVTKTEDVPDYVLDAKKAGDKARATRIKTHASNVPKVLGVHGLRPDIAYRWVDKSGSNVGTRETQGWAVVKDDKIIGPRHSGGSTIDTHDSILMATTLQNREDLRKATREKSDRRIKAAKTKPMLEEMRKTEVTTKTYDSALQAHEENTNIFE